MYKRILKAMGSPSASPRKGTGVGTGAPAAGTDGTTKGKDAAGAEPNGAPTSKQGDPQKVKQSPAGEPPPTVIHMTAAPAEALPISEQVLTATPQTEHVQEDMGQIAAAIVQRVSSQGDRKAGPAADT